MSGDSPAEARDADGDNAEDERRLFGGRREETAAYVAAGMGVARVDLVADRVGQFSLVHRCRATSLAATPDAVAVGTDESVLVDRGSGFESTGMRSAVAVGLDDGAVLAAGPDGVVSRDGEQVGAVTDPRRFEGNLLATGDGVVRVGESLANLGLADVRDVAWAEDGLVAATPDGLYGDVGRWTRLLESGVQAVASDGIRLAVVDSEGVLERREGDWERLDAPAQPVALTYGESLYGITAAGEFLVYTDPSLPVDGSGGWRSHALGLSDAVDLAVP
ncbi:MAG: hypothetical protein V5A55_01050 [Halovenus sp.]